MTTFTTTITLPSKLLVRNVAGSPVYWDIEATPVDCLADVLTGGANVILNNTFNSGGKDRTDAESLAQLQKRIDSWMAGNYRITERGASQSTLMRECYINEMMAKHATATAKIITDKMKTTVKDTLGKKENATFDNFILATATNMAKGKDEKRTVEELVAAITSKYEKLAAELEAERAKASNVELDMDMDI